MSPRTEETNQRIRDEQTKRIMDAAAKIFAHKGLAAAKMTDIASAAEVSYGLVYHYFTNKEGIFARLVERALQGIISLTQQALEHPGTPWERIQWLTSQMITGMHEQPELSMVVLQAFTNDTVPQEVQEMARQQSLVIQEAFKQLIVEGQAVGEVISGNAERLAALFSVYIQGMVVGAAFLYCEAFRAIRRSTMPSFSRLRYSMLKPTVCTISTGSRKR